MKESICTLRPRIALTAARDSAKTSSRIERRHLKRSNRNFMSVEFELWDAASAGNQIGGLDQGSGVNVVDGRFTVPINDGTNSEAMPSMGKPLGALYPGQPVSGLGNSPQCSVSGTLSPGPGHMTGNPILGGIDPRPRMTSSPAAICKPPSASR